MRLAYYAGASTAAAAACLLRAFHQRPNFYSATVYLSQSNACLLILTNLLLVTACSFMFALQRLLYGPLRPIEIEQLSEKAWYAVLDTLLAMPSFREDVGGWLLTMFVLLLAGKVWGWIGEGRVDVLEQQPPANPRLFHTRLATSLIVSVIFDIWMLNYCIETVVADPRPGMMVIFTFEFAILTIFSVFTLARYGLTLVDAKVVKKQTRLAVETRKAEIRAERAAAAATAQQNPTEDGTSAPASPAIDEPIEVDENEVDVPGWEEKRRYLFGLEVLTDFIKLVIYIVFFTVSITFNGLPMHIMRDVYMTFASFSKRVSDYVAYRKATSDMNTRYPDATTEEIRGDACIVCRETMVSWEQPAAGGDAQPAGGENAAAPVPARRRDEGLRAKKLPCGHILHLRCLKAWLERQQVCPTCRRPVVTANATANGAQPAANGQQRPQQPRARARMFNLGPLRVGLLNAPNDQMQNILNQIRNPEAANNQNADAANQQGPNHLGLQGQPYANGTTSSRNTGLRSSVPTHVQLLQLEQRIIQEAHNLGLEQQQLYNLRMMEAELSRLRAQHLPAQQPVGINGAIRQTPVAPQHLPHLPLPGLVPFQPFNLQQPLYAPPPPEVLQGSSAQQLGNESQNLPAGLTIPEGWTLMPLHRADAVQRDAPMAQELASTVQPTVDQHTSATTVPHTAVEQPVDHSIPAQSAQHTSSTGPTDEQGSPLFVPTPSIPQTQATVEQSSSQLDSQPAPLQGDASWSFDHDASRASSSHETTNGHAPEQSGKGKARAVEVEDAPDEENR